MFTECKFSVSPNFDLSYHLTVIDQRCLFRKIIFSLANVLRMTPRANQYIYEVVLRTREVVIHCKILSLLERELWSLNQIGEYTRIRSSDISYWHLTCGSRVYLGLCYEDFHWFELPFAVYEERKQKRNMNALIQTGM